MTEKYIEKLCNPAHRHLGKAIPKIGEEIADHSSEKALKFVKEGKKFRSGY